MKSGETITIRRWPGGPQDVILQPGMIVQAYQGTRTVGSWPFNRRTVQCWEEVTYQRPSASGHSAVTSLYIEDPEDLFLYRRESPSEIAELYERLTLEHWDRRLWEVGE